MKKYIQHGLLLLLLIIMLSPLFASVGLAYVKPAQSTDLRLRLGACGGTANADWDPASYDLYTIGNYYVGNVLEPLVSIPPQWNGDPDGVIPVLATDWIFEYWPEELNSHPIEPFINRGGVKSVTFTLRENVTFHDGSDWNATVAKWNIDRLMIQSGNLTMDPRTETGWQGFVWDLTSDWEDYFTPSWNLTWAKTWEPYYESFGIKYENPLGSPHGLFPLINSTEITESKDSGGKLKINFNHWMTSPLTLLGYPINMISMETYKDYFNVTIRGYGTHENFSSTFPHMVGTGPYIFQYHDELAAPPGGLAIRNDNWWNASAMQANGLHEVTHFDLVFFPWGETGLNARNTALLTGALDYATDSASQPLDYDAVATTPGINYIDTGIGTTITKIALNSINDTWWKDDFDSGGISRLFADSLGHMPKALRKALCFAFNYTKFCDIAMNGRVERAGGIITKQNTFYNPAWASMLPYTNLTIARQELIDSGLYDMKGLSLTNSTAEWRYIAQNDPIHVLNFFWDSTFADLKNVLEDSLRDIGITITDSSANELQPSVWQNIVDGNVGFILEGEGWPLDYTTHEDIGILNDLKWWYYNQGDWAYNWGFNGAFAYNDTVNYWIDQMFLSNRTRQEELINNLAEWAYNYQYPYMYIGSTKEGLALKSGWHKAYWYGPYDRDTVIARMWYVPEEIVYPEIPGAPVTLIVVIGLFALISEICVMKRKLSSR